MQFSRSRYIIIKLFYFVGQQAIEHKSFIGDVRRITRGNPEEAMKTADFVREGQVHMGGQEHFYLETHCCLVIPKEEDDLEIICSTQNAAEIQVICRGSGKS